MCNVVWDRRLGDLSLTGGKPAGREGNRPGTD